MPGYGGAVPQHLHQTCNGYLLVITRYIYIQSCANTEDFCIQSSEKFDTTCFAGQQLVRH